MRMATDHGINFPHGGVSQQFFCNQHVDSFQPKDVNSTTSIFPGDMNTSGGIITMTEMISIGNSSTPNNVSPMILTSNPPGNILLEPVPGLKHIAAFAVDWSCEELEVLKRGLVTYASEPNIMKYIKIAARLPEKTVRDVAKRCRWMTRKENGKRCKSDELYAGKKIKDRKEKMIGCSSMVNMHYNQPDSESAYSVMMCDGNHMNQFSSEAFPVVDSRTKNLLEDNVKLLHQIAVNIENNEHA